MANALAIAVLSAALLLPVAGETRWSATSEAPRIGIFLAFDGEFSKVSIQMMEREVGAVLAATGAKFSWLGLNREEQSETFDRLAVFHLQGSCRMTSDDPSTPAGAARLTLGSSDLDSGEVGSFGAIGCDQIRECISGLLSSSGPIERETAFGRALGRVMAHELYHILGNTTEHTRSGVTRALQSPLDLVRENFHLDRRVLLWLRERLQNRKIAASEPVRRKG